MVCAALLSSDFPGQAFAADASMERPSGSEDLLLHALSLPQGYSAADGTVDSAGTLHVVLVRGGDAFYSKRGKERREFSAPVRINARPGTVVAQGPAGPKLDIGPGGEIYVVRHHWRDPLSDVYIASSNDDGATFKESKLGRGLLPNVAVAPDGIVYVIWIGTEKVSGVQMAAPLQITRSTDGGRTFATPSVIRGSPVACGCCLPDIEVNAHGQVLVAYRGADANVRDIHLLRSRNGISGFTSTLVHADNWILNACPNSGPVLAFDDPTGTLAVAWSSEGRALMAFSPDFGQTFMPPEVLPDRAGEPEGSPLLGFDTHGVAAVAWKAEREARGILLRRERSVYFFGESGLFALEPQIGAEQ